MEARAKEIEAELSELIDQSTEDTVIEYEDDDLWIDIGGEG